MKNTFLAILIAACSISCATDSTDVVSQETKVNNSSIVKREGSTQYPAEDLVDIKVLSTTESPLSTEQEDGVAKALGFRCKVTDHFTGVNTGTQWFHVVCGTTHWIIACYPNGTWGEPWVETPYDTHIWHKSSGKTSARTTEVTEEQQEAIDIIVKDVELKGSNETGRITCHTSYANTHEGHACVTLSNGHVYDVSWTDLVVYAPGHLGFADSPTYSAVPVKSCNC